MENEIKIPESNSIPTDYEIEEQQIISVSKFILLSIVTIGFYELWWFYNAWRFFKQKEKSDIMPVCRTIFNIFFIWQLFDKILKLAKEKNYEKDYASGLLFSGFILFTVSAYLPEPYFLISIFIFIVFIPPFKAFNFVKQNSTGFKVNEQKTFNGRQITLIVIGTLFWILFFIWLLYLNGENAEFN
jgi:hypothetical protein